MEQKIIEVLISAGSGVLIAVIVLIGIYRLTNKFGEKFLLAHQAQSEAINRLTDTLERSVEKDQSEHREMIILLKVIMERVDKNGHTERTL